MFELVPETTDRPIEWWCADCAAMCIVNDESRCTGCDGDLTVELPQPWSQVSRVRAVAEHCRENDVELEDAAGALLPLIRTPEDLCRWLAVVVGSPGAELDCARHLSLENELQEVAQHLLSELGESEARLGRLEAWVREQALAAGLPLAVTTAAERVVHLSPQDLVLALGEAAARGRDPAELGPTLEQTQQDMGDWRARFHLLESRVAEQVRLAGLPLTATTAAGDKYALESWELLEALGHAAVLGIKAPAPAPLAGTLTLTHGLEALAAYEAGAPARPADPTADELRDLRAEVDRLSAEVEGHQAAARRAVGLLQRTAGALRVLDAEVQAGSWRGAEQHLGAPLSDQTLRGLADHVEGELRRIGGRA